MNEEALNDAYNLFVETGYKGSVEDFTSLIQTNEEALNDAYNLFVETGYKGSNNDFKQLVSTNDISNENIETSKKKVPTEVETFSDGVSSLEDTLSASVDLSQKEIGEANDFVKDQYRRQTYNDAKLFGEKGLPDTYEEWLQEIDPQEPTTENFNRIKEAQDFENQAYLTFTNAKDRNKIKDRALEARSETKLTDDEIRQVEEKYASLTDDETTVVEDIGAFFRGHFEKSKDVFNLALDGEFSMAIKRGVLPPIMKYDIDSKEDLLYQKSYNKKKDYFSQLSSKEKRDIEDFNKFDQEGAEKQGKFLQIENTNTLSKQVLIKKEMQQLADDKLFAVLKGKTQSEKKKIFNNFTQEEKETFSNNYKRLTDLGDDFNKNIQLINSNEEDLMTFDQEKDLLKRQYSNSDITNKLGVFAASMQDIVLGLGEVSVDIFSAVGSSVDGFDQREEFREAIRSGLGLDKGHKNVEELRSILAPRMGLQDINNVGDIGTWFGELFAEQVPILATLYATGGLVGGGALGTTVGGATIGASVYGTKLNQLQKEGGDLDWKDRLVAGITGGAEFFSERFTAGLLSKAGRTIKSISVDGLENEFKRSFGKSVAKVLANTGGEAGSEGLSQLAENYADILILKKDKDIFEGVAEAFVSGAALGGVITTVPQVFGSILAKRYGDSRIMSDMASTQKTIDGLIGEMMNPDISEKTFETLEKRALELQELNKKRSEKLVSRIEALDATEIKEIGKIESNIYEAESAIKEVEKDSQLKGEVKENVLNSLKMKVEKLKRQRDQLTAEKTTNNTQEDGAKGQQETKPKTEPRVTEEKGDKSNPRDVQDGNDQKTEKQIKENGKKMATAVRSAKFYKTVPDAMRNLQSDPTGLAKFAWDGAMETLAKSIELGSSMAQSVNDAIKTLKESEWYKKLSTEGQKQSLKIMKEHLETSVKPYYEAQVKPSRQKPKTTIRKNTGQTDLSDKVVTTKAKQLAQYFKTQQIAARKAGFATKKAISVTKSNLNRFIDTKLKGLDSLIGKGATKRLKSAVANVNEKNYDKIVANIESIIEAVDKKQRATKIDKYKKRAKKKIKTTYNRYGDVVRRLVRLNTQLIPTELLNEYQDIMQSLSRNKGVDFQIVNEFYDKVSSIYETQVTQESQEKTNREKEVKDNTEQVSKIKSIFSKFEYDKSLFNEFEQDTIDNFLSIPTSYLKERSVAELNRMIKSLEAVSNGWINNKVLRQSYNTYLAREKASQIKEELGDTFIKPVHNMVDGIMKLFKSRKSYTVNDYSKALKNVMVQHIDRVVKGMKGTILYDNVFHPITSRFSKANELTNATEKAFTAKLSKARESREGTRVKRIKTSVLQALNLKKGNYNFDLNIILQLYFRQREYNDNIELRGSKVFSAKAHLEKTFSNASFTGLSQSSIERIKALSERFTDSDGEISLQMLEDYFTNQETELIEFMDEVLLESQQKSREVNDHVKGESLLYPNSYFPRKTSSSQIDDLDISQTLSGVMGSTTTKASASNKRVVNSAQPLDFNTTQIFMSHVFESNVEHQLAETVKNVGVFLSELGKTDNESLGRLVKAVDIGVKGMISSQLDSTAFKVNSRAESAFKFLVRNTFKRMLIDPIRFTYDFVSNTFLFYAHHPDMIPTFIKSRKVMSQDFVQNTLLKDFSTVHDSRIGGSRSVDYKEAAVSSINKSRYKQYQPNILDNMLDLFKKNKISDFTDRLSEIYYKVVDAPSRAVWAKEFMENFESISGESFSSKKYKSDNTYKKKYKSSIEQAINKADKMTSNYFNTASKAENKLKVQEKRASWVNNLDSFMRSFTFNESQVFWDSLHSIFNKGSMSRKEGARLFTYLNTRAMGYAFLSQTAVSQMLAMMGVDEEDEEVMERAMKRSVAQHGMLVVAGNRGNLFNMAAGFIFERFHKMYVESEEGEKYDPFKDSYLYTPPERGTASQYLGMLGAEGYALRALYDSYSLAEKILTDEGDLTEEDLVEYKSLQITMSLFSQLTGAPTDKFGKLSQKLLDNIYEVKRGRKTKKKTSTSWK